MSRTLKFISILFFASLLNTSSFSQMFAQEPSERIRTYDVRHITIDVKLNLEKKTVAGKTVTTIVPLNNSFTSFEVDAVGMEIKSVRKVQYVSQGMKDLFGEPKPKYLIYSYDKNKLTINLDREYSTFDSITYIVDYLTTDPEKGMYFISPSETFPNKPYQVWTQGEGEDNRYWFPCYDYPNDMATTEIYVTVDKKYQTLSNGLVKEKKENGDRTVTWHWVQELPHVSYLVMLGVGNWDVIEDSWSGIPISSYVPPGKMEWGRRSYRNTTDVLKFFSEYTGFTYPWGKFSQVAVEDFIYGGMENTGAVVLFDGSCYDEKTEPDYNATNLVAHELAHMWWGDAVTCSNWNEIWLNESFATYFQCLYTEHLLGKNEFDYNIYRNGRDAIKADSTVRKPIYTREGLTTNTYDKGSVVLNMLRNLIGDEKFRKAMNIYITENKHTPVVTKDFVDAVHKGIDEGTDITMPANLVWFFEEWIYKAGQPEIEAGYSYYESAKEITVTAKQIQRLDSSSVFRTPFKYTIITSTGSNDYEMVTGLEPKSHRIKLDSEPLCVIFNKGNKVLCKLYFTKPKADWLYQLTRSEDAIDRITALKGLRDFIDEDDVVSAVLNSAQTDSFWGVRYEAAQLLSYSKNKKAQESYVTSLVDEKDSRVRRSYILGLGNYFDNYPELQENSGVLASFLINLADHETSYYAAADAITSLEKILKGAELYENVLPFLGKDSHVDIIRRSVIAAIDSTNDPRSLDVLLYWAQNGSTARLRNAAINGLGSFADDPKAVEFLKITIFKKPRSTQGAILGIIENSRSVSWKPVLEELLEASNDVRFKERIGNVIQKLN